MAAVAVEIKAPAGMDDLRRRLCLWNHGQIIIVSRNDALVQRQIVGYHLVEQYCILSGPGPNQLSFTELLMNWIVPRVSE